MGLSKKLVKAVKQAQKQAEATVAEVRGVLDSRLSDVNVDPAPFYAVIGAANRAVDTIKHAGEQLEAARKQANSADLRDGARKEAADLQKELQKRIADLQVRAAEMQKLAGQLAEKVLARAQDIPAQVMNQGLVIASNAKDQYDAAADRGERVVSEMRGHAEQATDEAAAAAEALATPPSEEGSAPSDETDAPATEAVPTAPVETVPTPVSETVPAPTSETITTPTGEVPATVVDEEEDLTQTVAEAVQDEAEELKEQLEGAAPALDEAAAAEEAGNPLEPAAKKAAAKKVPAKKAPAKKMARRPMESGAAKPTPATVAAKKPGPTPAK
jgi:hypothetical protein